MYVFPVKWSSFLAIHKKTVRYLQTDIYTKLIIETATLFKNDVTFHVCNTVVEDAKLLSDDPDLCIIYTTFVFVCIILSVHISQPNEFKNTSPNTWGPSGCSMIDLSQWGSRKKLPHHLNDLPHHLVVLCSNLPNDHGHFDEV